MFMFEWKAVERIVRISFDAQKTKEIYYRRKYLQMDAQVWCALQQVLFPADRIINKFNQIDTYRWKIALASYPGFNARTID